MSPLTESTRLVLKKPTGSGWTITPQTKVPVDPQYGSVSLLLHGNGTNGSTTITDNSPSPKTVTCFGSAQISTAQSKPGFGQSLLLQDISRFEFTNIGTSLEFPGDYTIESWIYLPTLSVLDVSSYVTANSAATLYHALNVDSTNFSLFLNAGTPALTVAHNLIAATWHHIALCRGGSTVRVFTDGVQKGSVTSSITHGFPSTNIERARIGGGGGVSGTRYHDDFRITKGIARYTANFSPPAAPFPDI